MDFVDPYTLVANKWNSNKVDRENFEKLKLSLKSLGNFKPVIVRQRGDSLEILGGYHRCEAAKELGTPKIPIINLGEIDDDRAKEISLVDNTRYGVDDTELLSQLLDSIDTELLEVIMPDIPTVTIEEDHAGLAEEISKSLMSEREEDHENKVLKFKLEIDKAEEIEAILSKIAAANDYKYPDGYANFSEALYHALVLDK